MECENSKTFGPQSHVGLSSEGKLNSWSNSAPQSTGPTPHGPALGALSGRSAARATVGGEFPSCTLSVVQRVPNSTVVHGSASPPTIPDGRLSRVRFWPRLCTPFLRAGLPPPRETAVLAHPSPRRHGVCLAPSPRCRPRVTQH